MALIVSNSKIKNTEIDAPTMYVRLQFIALYEGSKSNVFLKSYLSKEVFDNDSKAFVETNIPELLLVQIPIGQNQDLSTIHTLTKDVLEQLGFVVTIDLA